MWVRLEDTDRTPGHRELDQVFIDLLFVRTVAGTGGSVPDAPGGVTASATGPATILVEWADVIDEVGFNVQRATAVDGTYNTVGTVAADLLEFTDTGLASGTTYWYQVVAFNAAGSSPASEKASATTGLVASLHLGDLAAALINRNKNWTMTVTATVHDADHGPVSGAVVSGNWQTGGNASCTTNGFGTCDVSSTNKSRVSQEAFTVTDIVATGYVYGSGMNDVSVSVSSAVPDAAISGDVALDDSVPTVVTMRPNYPNPFNPSTVIEFGLPARQHVSVVVYNVLGMEVARLIDDVADEGWHRVTFDAGSLTSGVYIAVTRTAGRSLSRVLLLAK